MKPGKDSDFFAILAALNRHGVEYIVVGGIGAIIQGAPISTLDLDVVHQRDADNITHLINALEEIHARYRLKPGISPAATHLVGPGHQLLITDGGPLDVLGSIGHGWDFQRLLPYCRIVTLDDVGPVRVLELGKLIEVKEETATDKDRAVLPILKQTLRNQGAT